TERGGLSGPVGGGMAGWPHAVSPMTTHRRVASMPPKGERCADSEQLRSPAAHAEAAISAGHLFVGARQAGRVYAPAKRRSLTHDRRAHRPRAGPPRGARGGG